jgi:hypothetical protein
MSSKGFTVLPTHTSPSSGPHAATGTRSTSGSRNVGAGDTGRIANLAMPSRWSGGCPCGGMSSGGGAECDLGKLKIIFLIFLGSGAMVALFFSVLTFFHFPSSLQLHYIGITY